MLSSKTNSIDNHSYSEYRAWPIFLLSFVRLFYVSIFERALSNYLLWDILIPQSTLGFITSAGALIYIVAPIIGQFITYRYLGIRSALIFSAVTTPILTGAQIIFPVPWFLITCRVTLGITMGFFWPNCLNLLSRWQRISSMERSKKNFAFFNISWNIGFILGLIVGFLWAFSWSDFFAMIVSWTLSFLLIPVSLFIQKESKQTKSDEIVIYQTEDPLSHLDIEEDLIVNRNTPMVIYPILFSWIAILFLTISKSSFAFSFQILLKSFNGPSYYTYLIQGGIQSTQLIGLTLINSMGVYKRKFASFTGVIFIILFALGILFSRNIILISILSASVGLFLGLIHGTGMKIMLEKGAAQDTSKYATINEILIGIGFGLTPIVAGIVSEVNPYSIFAFIGIFGLIILVLLIFLSRNVKKSQIYKL
ncbi:MAG: MFS transporter [Candidatus Thorarchaeota archaeon]